MEKLEFEKPGFEILQIDEKPLAEVNINAGIYVMNKAIKNSLKEKQDMPNLLDYLKKKLQYKFSNSIILA